MDCYQEITMLRLLLTLIATGALVGGLAGHGRPDFYFKNYGDYFNIWQEFMY